MSARLTHWHVCCDYGSGRTGVNGMLSRSKWQLGHSVTNDLCSMTHYSPAQWSWRGVYWFHLVCSSVRLSIHPSVHYSHHNTIVFFSKTSVRPFVRLWKESSPLCVFYNTCQFHFIFTHLIKQFQKVCNAENVTIWWHHHVKCGFYTISEWASKLSLCLLDE